MAKKFTQLPIATPLDGSEIAAVTQDGESRQTTTQDIADLGGGGGSQSLQDVIDVSSTLTSPVSINSADYVEIITDAGSDDKSVLKINPDSSSDSYFNKESSDNLSLLGMYDHTATIASYDKTNTHGDVQIQVRTDGQNIARVSSTNAGATESSRVEVTPLVARLVGGNSGTSKVEVTSTDIKIHPGGTSPNLGNILSGDAAGKAVWQARITQTINNGATTTAPSEDAVYDAIQSISGYTSTPPEIVFASISGQTMKNRVLTANKYFRDIDGTSEGATTFQWVRADDANGTNVANIASATSSTYTLVTADMTKYIAVKITPVNSSAESGSVYTTAYVGAVDDIYYPADQSNIVISFGIKKMAVAYAGNCMQIQLISAGPTTNIGFDANGDVDWALIASTAGGGNAFLKIWYDQSGNGFNMTFSAFAKQPVVNYILKRIEWITTNDAIVTHNAAMNIGTGDFSFFMEATQRTLMDSTFTFFEKKTNFSTNNWQLYSPLGYGMLMYTGDASVNTLQAQYATPDRRTVIAGYRSSTAKFLNTDGVIKTANETATNLTSTTDIKFNTGDGGTGEWYMWSWTFYLANKGADYSKYKKFVSP